MQNYTIGIDEAGRGPLAGPVSVGVVMVSKDFDWGRLSGVNDSKQLTEKKREELFEEARRLKVAEQLDYAVVMVSAKVIDRIDIVPAVNLAMSRALKKIETNNRARTVLAQESEVRLDGGLKAPERFIYQETIIKGDSKEKVIGLASIMAKVTRDRYMVRNAAKPQFAPYNFSQHKGYGTKSHREAIQKNGMTELHRKTYCKNIKVL